MHFHAGWRILHTDIESATAAGRIFRWRGFIGLQANTSHTTAYYSSTMMMTRKPFLASRRITVSRWPQATLTIFIGHANTTMFPHAATPRASSLRPHYQLQQAIPLAQQLMRKPPHDMHFISFHTYTMLVYCRRQLLSYTPRVARFSQYTRRRPHFDDYMHDLSDGRANTHHFVRQSMIRRTFS